MIKNLTQLEFMIADKVYHFVCAPDAPLEHVKEALCQFIKYVGQVQDQVSAMEAAKKEQEQKQAADQPVAPIAE